MANDSVANERASEGVEFQGDDGSSPSSPRFKAPKTVYTWLVDGFRMKNYVVVVKCPDPKENLLYFPGDVQTFQRDMLTKETDYSDFVSYSLENTAALLSNKFPTANVCVVCPSRFQRYLSDFDALLRPGEGMLHCEAVLKSVLLKMGQEAQFNLPIKLVAFSKGGLVLNNLLAEVANSIYIQSKLHSNLPLTEYVFDWEADIMAGLLPPYEPSRRIGRLKVYQQTIVPNIPQILSFFNKVEAMHWVDCHRYPTNDLIFKMLGTILSFLPARFFVHISPRQLYDQYRKYIKKEHDDFLVSLQKNNISFFSKLYLEDHPKDLSTHFRVLNIFESHVPIIAPRFQS